jgi:mannose-6-phosphate isomerase-like protein (cupin superfamily)
MLLVLGALGQPPQTAAPAAPAPRAPAAQPTFTRAAKEPSPKTGNDPRRRIDYIPAERFAEARARVANTRSVGTSVFVAPDQQTAYMVVRRTVASEVEEHSRWDDLVVVQSGRGAIDLGRGATKGARFVAPGELRGGELLRPGRVELRPGDVVRVPAGVPHSFVPLSQEPWELLLIKVRRPNKPLKRDPATVAEGQAGSP